ncbi:hypothetical protein ARMSODRAFT_607256 [Armillaria solidipes]|uniref:Uncharacterized protein n=1 Tax=Armillaria solidipes TaxID=1076256 RepID=A0A2H3BCN2_9AGAR|nr:hypothetical protein ARMSODRAFT_607256 [Armillaria solidipes]
MAEVWRNSVFAYHRCTDSSNVSLSSLKSRLGLHRYRDVPLDHRAYLDRASDERRGRTKALWHCSHAISASTLVHRRVGPDLQRIKKQTHMEMIQENSYEALGMVILRAVHISRASLKLVLLGPRNFDTFSPKNLPTEALTK